MKQKKDFHFQAALDEEYQVVKNLGFKPGMSKFYEGILCNKGDGIMGRLGNESNCAAIPINGYIFSVVSMPYSLCSKLYR
jgi:hypothetical protein